MDDTSTINEKEGSNSAEVENQTVHTNPNWLKNINKSRDFHSEIISKCCKRTRDAVENNENIKDIKTWTYTENEIINLTIEYLEHVFGGLGSPKLKDLRIIAVTMTHVYPAMFLGSEDEELSSYGKVRNVGDIDSLAQKLSYRYRDRVGKKRSGSPSIQKDVMPVKKGKQKDYYGVDNKRFLGIKATAATIASVRSINEEEDFESREAIYNEKRSEIQYMFRTSPKNIQNMCRGFFMNHKHLANQFEYLSRTNNLINNVKQNLPRQMDIMERVLKRIDTSVDMMDKLAEIQTECDVDYNGLVIFKFIHLLRLGGNTLDKDGSALVRFVEDGKVSHPGPFIMAVQVDKAFIFELWVEHSKLLVNLDLIEVIASFLHLAFVFGLEYPQDANTVADILQRLVASYGDDSGT